MRAPIPTSERDLELLRTLTVRVKLLTVEQVARTWWGTVKHPLDNARKRIRELERDGLLRRITVLAHPELPLPAPVQVWYPGEPPPHFGHVSYALCSRWTEGSRPIVAVIATQATANHFGGAAGRMPKGVEQNHDVHMAAVYLRIRALQPSWLPVWISEARIRQSRPDGPGEKLPDAMVRLATGLHVIDFGGAYSAPKLEAFHVFCERKGYSYELW